MEQLHNHFAYLAFWKKECLGNVSLLCNSLHKKMMLSVSNMVERYLRVCSVLKGSDPLVKHVCAICEDSYSNIPISLFSFEDNFLLRIIVTWRKKIHLSSACPVRASIMLSAAKDIVFISLLIGTQLPCIHENRNTPLQLWR